MTDNLAVLEELKSRLNAIEFDVACGNLSAAQTFTKVRDAHAAAIALMRGQSGDAERFAWLCTQDCGIGDMGYGDYAGYAYAKPDKVNGRLGLRDVCDAAMQQTEKK